MAAEAEHESGRATRLFSTYLPACAEVHTDSVMLWEVIGDEIQTVSLRVAAESMRRLKTGEA